MEIREEEWTLEFFEETKEMMYEWLDGLEPTSQKAHIDPIVYRRASMRGELVLFVPRVNGRAVGYLKYWLIDDMNHESHIAQQAGIYLEEEHRGNNAFKLIKFAEKTLKEKYKVDVIVHISTNKKDLGPFFKYLKYREAETTYIKEI